MWSHTQKRRKKRGGGKPHSFPGCYQAWYSDTHSHAPDARPSPTLDSPVPRQRRPMVRYFREDVDAPWNGLRCFPGQSKDRSLPSPVSSTTASPSSCAVCFISGSWFFLLQPQNPKHLTFLLAAVRFRQDQVVVCGRCHPHLRGSRTRVVAAIRRWFIRLDKC